MLCCRDNDTLVFIEVKTRTRERFSAPSTGSGRSCKQKRISRGGALAWLRMLENPDILFRFDVVEVIVAEDAEPRVELIRNAFHSRSRICTDLESRVRRWTIAVLVGNHNSALWPNPSSSRNPRSRFFLLPKMANRHGLIAGATGTGKTVTLQTLAENFSARGVAVFMADVKGDLAGLSQAGANNPKVVERAKELKIDNFTGEACPVVFWDVFGEQGHPVRATVSEMGPAAAWPVARSERHAGGACSTWSSKSRTITGCSFSI